MKKLIIFSMVLMASLMPISGYGVQPMTKTKDGTYVINTTTLCNAKGFKGATPVEVHIKKGLVVKVEPLTNQESPDYFAKIKKNLLPLYNNVKVSKAKKEAVKTQVDGCTGATYSTKAVQQNIKVALDYYDKHK